MQLKWQRTMVSLNRILMNLAGTLWICVMLTNYILLTEMVRQSFWEKCCGFKNVTKRDLRKYKRITIKKRKVDRLSRNV